MFSRLVKQMAEREDVTDSKQQNNANSVGEDNEQESSRRNRLYQSHLQLKNGGYPLMDTRHF